MTDSVFIGGWLEFIFNNYFVQSSARKSFFTVVPALFSCPPLSITKQNFPFIANRIEKIIVCSKQDFTLTRLTNY